MNTRKYDLEELEKRRDAGSKAAKQTLEKVFRQSKDSETERLRRLLIDAHKRRDLETVERIGEELRSRG